MKKLVLLAGHAVKKVHNVTKNRQKKKKLRRNGKKM